MREKRRLKAEQKAIKDAEGAVRKIANAFLQSDEGRLTVREEALKRLATVQLPKKSALSKLLRKFK